MTKGPKLLTAEMAQAIEAQVDEEIESEKAKDIDAFDSLYAEYLEARARTIRPIKSDAARDRVCDERDTLLWQVIHTPAVMSYHVDYKFRV